MSIDPVSLAVTAALTAAQMALQMTNKIEGPRLDSLDVTVADYGTPLNYFYGTRRFSAVPIIWAEPIREVKRKSKTKGGKHTEYSYFGSWAVVVADHLIDRVTRIWFDKHLVYDVTGPGPVQVFNIGTTRTTNKGKGTRTTNIQLSEHLRIYLGTEDQEADPRMLADVESKHGAGSCPAYKGVAYIVFEEIPLEKFGNRIPQISVEAITSNVPSYPWETKTIAYTNFFIIPGNTAISPDGTKLFWTDGSNFELWHLPSRSRLRYGPMPGVYYGGAGIYSNGSMLLVSDNNYHLLGYSPDGVYQSNVFDFTHEQAGVQVLQDGNGVEHWATIPWSYLRYHYVDGTEYLTDTDAGAAFTVGQWFTDGDGQLWGVGRLIGPFVNATQLFLWRPGSAAIAFTMPAGGPGAGVNACHVASAGHFLVRWNDKFYTIDDQTFTITGTSASFSFNDDVDAQFRNLPAGATSIWFGFTEFSLVDLSVIRTVNWADWKVEGSRLDLYSSVLHAIITWANTPLENMTIRYLDRPAREGVTLETAINDVSTRCGLDLAEVDASEMDQPINYSWTQGSGRDILEPLLDVHDSIVRPHNFGVEFIKLGRASLGSLGTQDFVTDGGPHARFDIDREQDTDLPRRVSVNYSDLNADQQPNNAADQIPLDVTDGVRELTLNLATLAMVPDDAQRLVERWLRRRRFGRETYKFAVTSRLLKIEPGDVYDVEFDGIAKRGRVKTATIEKRGVLQIEMKRDDPLIATLSGSTGQAASGHEPEVLLIPMPTRAFIIDTTYVTDADDAVAPFLYIGAGPVAAGAWLGAAFYEANDGINYDAEVANVPSYFPANWGYCMAALYDVPTCGLWDRGAGITVKVPNGSLVSITEAQANADPTLNRIIFESGEQVQFTTATLQSDGSYLLTGLKRGRRGTEWATGLHTAGEAFIFTDSTLQMGRGASDIARSLYFKAMGPTDVLENIAPVSLTYQGRTHKPYAPAHVDARKDAASGDWTITWIRRTRLGGTWTGGGTIPLGETSEAYEVAILNGSSEVRVLSSITESATYTAAQQATDFGGGVAMGDLDFAVYQMSDIAGRGFATAASF